METRYNATIHISIAIAEAMDKIRQAMEDYKKRQETK